MGDHKSMPLHLGNHQTMQYNCERGCAVTLVTLDPERQKQAKAYARIRRRLLVVDVALGGLYAVAWLAMGWATWLKGALQGSMAGSNE